VAVMVSTIATSVVGHFQGMLMVKQQPMKMAAAEALFESEGPAPFSLFAVGSWAPNPERTNVDVQVPKLLSWLSTGNFNSEVEGINDLNASYRKKYGPGEYAPIVGLTYWSFRAMIGAGTLMIALTALLLWRGRRGRLPDRRRLLWLMLPAAALPFVANTAGWVFTEMGRQPWVVQGLLKTSDAVSPTVNATTVAISMAGFTLLYGVLAVIGFGLFARTAAAGPPDAGKPGAPPAQDLVLAY
jgi:cytochrome d ubiquinol oxidase subunit I